MKNKILFILLIFISSLVFSQNKSDKNNMISVDLLKNINIDEVDPDNPAKLIGYKEKINVFTSKDIIKYDKGKNLLTIKKTDLNKLYRKILLIKLDNDLTTGCFDTILYSSVNTMQYKCKIILWDYYDMIVNKTLNKNETVIKMDFKDKTLEKKWNKIVNN